VPDLAATRAIIIDVPETVINAPVRRETNIMITGGANQRRGLDRNGRTQHQPAGFHTAG
jgi:hypothetical protein